MRAVAALTLAVSKGTTGKRHGRPATHANEPCEAASTGAHRYRAAVGVLRGSCHDEGMAQIKTAIGDFFISDPSLIGGDVRVGVSEVVTVENMGPNSTHSWSLDQEEALLAAAAEVGAILDLEVPGGWRLRPSDSRDRFATALVAATARMHPSGRLTPARG